MHSITYCVTHYVILFLSKYPSLLYERGEEAGGEKEPDVIPTLEGT